MAPTELSWQDTATPPGGRMQTLLLIEIVLINTEPNRCLSHSVTVGHRVGHTVPSVSFFVLTQNPGVLTISPILNTTKQQLILQKRRSRHWRGKKYRSHEWGPIDKRGRNCDLFTAVCYVETRESLVI